MREIFANLDEERKQNIYEQLYEYIKNDNLDALQDILKKRINLSYKLKKFSSEEQIYIEDYLDSPLGLALYKDKKFLNELLKNCYIEDLESHGPVYLYLAAKEESENSVFFAQQLIDFFAKNNAKLNLDFMINERVLDFDVIGKKDFVEIAIENNREDFIEWLFGKNFVETGVFSVKISHIKNSLRNSNVNISKKLFYNHKIPLSELIKELENKFLYVSTEVSYIKYVEKFNLNVYNDLGEILFTQAAKQKDLFAILWLLKKGFFFQIDNDSGISRILDEMQKKYPEENLLFIGVNNKNYGLIQFLLQSGNVSIKNIIEYCIKCDWKINVDFFESISNHLNDFLIENDNYQTKIDLFRIIYNSLYYRLFKLIATFSEQNFNSVIQEMFNQNMQNIVLQIFFKIVTKDDHVMLNKFLSLSASLKEFILNGDDQQTGLSIACENKYLESVKSLLPHMNIIQINKNFNKNNYYENITALWITLAFNFLEGAECLLNIHNIELNNGKGKHYKFENNMSISSKELIFLYKKEKDQKKIGFYNSYRNIFSSKQLEDKQEIKSKDIELDNLLPESEGQIVLASDPSNPRLNCSL